VCGVALILNTARFYSIEHINSSLWSISNQH
jgi:hypothetical protein